MDTAALTRLTPAEVAALGEFASAVGALLGSTLEELRLFGSRARGDGHEESDLDVAVVVSSVDRPARRQVSDLAFDVGLRHGVVLAPLVIERRRLDDLRVKERLIASDIDREGIVL
jgi:uncharacterized protein